TRISMEEGVMAANVEAATRMRRDKNPGLYRVQEGPDADKHEELVAFLRTFNFKFGPGGISPKEINRIIERVAGKPEAELVETVILRSLKQARYQPKNVGHFGLALPAYAHFTSPIRRNPNLLVHRAIKWVT